MLSKILPVLGHGLTLLEETDPTPTPEPFSMTTLLADSGDIFGSMMDWVGDVFDVIVSNPILLLFIVGTFALVAIGIVRRLLSL